jgi:hypothetical protein
MFAFAFHLFFHVTNIALALHGVSAGHVFHAFDCPASPFG